MDQANRLAAQSVIAAEQKGCGAAERELLRLAAAAAYLHIGAFELSKTALADLAHREDLYEPKFVLAAIDLRCGRLSQHELWQRRRTIEELPVECPQKQRVLGEFWYHEASLPGKAAAAWEWCLRTLEASPWTMPIEQKEGHLLKGLAMLMLGQKGAFSRVVPATGNLGWLRILRFAGEYLSTKWECPLPRGKIPLCDLPPPSIFRSEHIALLRLVVEQAVGDARSSGALLNQFDHWTADEFLGILLLRARQCRLERRSQALDYYQQLLERIQCAEKPHALIDVVLDEMSLCSKGSRGSETAKGT